MKIIRNFTFIIIFALAVYSAIHLFGLDSSINDVLFDAALNSVLGELGIPIPDFILIFVALLAAVLYLCFARKDYNDPGLRILGRLGLIICILNLVLSFTPVGIMAPILASSVSESKAEAGEMYKESMEKDEREHPKKGRDYTFTDIGFEKIPMKEDEEKPLLYVTATLTNNSGYDWDGKFISISVHLNGNEGGLDGAYYFTDPVKPGESVRYEQSWRLLQEDLDWIESVDLEIDSIYF